MIPKQETHVNKPAQAVVLALSLFVGSLAHAAVVTWNLLDVTFDDGAQATGFFTLDDSVPGFLADFDITTTSGTLPGFRYLPGNVNQKNVQFDGIVLSIAFQTGIGVLVSSDIINPDLSLVLGGTIPLTTESFEVLNGVFRNVESGSITAVPEPSVLAFLGIGAALFGLAYIGRRRPSYTTSNTKTYCGLGSNNAPTIAAHSSSSGPLNIGLDARRYQ